MIYTCPRIERILSVDCVVVFALKLIGCSLCLEYGGRNPQVIVYPILLDEFE